MLYKGPWTWKERNIILKTLREIGKSSRLSVGATMILDLEKKKPSEGKLWSVQKVIFSCCKITDLQDGIANFLTKRDEMRVLAQTGTSRN